MLRLAIPYVLGLALVACTGTRTGNPTQDPYPVPQGVELVRSTLTRDASPAPDAERDRELAAGNREFAWDLYRELADAESNLFFSPYSISVALAMTYAGTKGNTEAELARAMHFTLPQAELHEAFNATAYSLASRKDQLAEVDGAPPTSGDGFELSIVNQAWGQKDYTFLDSYLDVLGVNYGAGLFLIDFTTPDPARRVINGWVEDQTKQRIKDLLPEFSLTAYTKLVLTNAIYFKASWLEKFDEAATKPGTFKAPGGERSVQLMEQRDVNYGEGVDYQAVSLRYLAPDVSMVLILPAEGQFEALQSRFDAVFFDAVRRSLGEKASLLRLPRWKFESENKLKVPLQALGVRDAFASGAADLSGMDGMPGRLYIEEVFHKAFVAVDEEGTEAAAATAVVIRAESASLPREIVFDRPFMFVIYDEPTGHILFAGQLVDPGSDG